MSQSDINSQDTTKHDSKLSGINNDIVPLPSEPYDNIILSSNNNMRILYLTFAIIIGLLLLWIIIVVVTKEDPIKVLNDMTDIAAQINPVSDVKGLQSSQNINTTHINNNNP